MVWLPNSGMGLDLVTEAALIGGAASWVCRARGDAPVLDLDWEERVLAAVRCALTSVDSLSDILDTVARAAVPNCADWCVVYRDGATTGVTPSAVSSYPFRQNALNALFGLDSAAVQAYFGVPQAIQGRTCWRTTPPGFWGAVAGGQVDLDDYTTVAAITPHQVMSIPIVADGPVWGVLALSRTHLRSSFRMCDLNLASRVCELAAVRLAAIETNGLGRKYGAWSEGL